jgi:hypothetical protein
MLIIGKLKKLTGDKTSEEHSNAEPQKTENTNSR